MRPTFRPAAVAVVLVAALSVTGCVPGPAAPHTPAPTSTPLFASDEEALAAAEEAYAAYLAVTDEIFADGAQDLTRLESVSTGKQFDVDTSGFEDMAASGYRSVGMTTFADMQLQQYSPNVESEVVVVYLCEDVSDVDVIDSQGHSVVQGDRPDRVKYEVSFDPANVGDLALRVSDREPWRDGQC